MKKFFGILLILCMAVMTLVACGDPAVTGIELSGTVSEINYNTDLSDVKVKVLYDDGTKGDAVSVTSDMMTGFDKTKLGKQTVTVTYSEQTADFDVTVVDYVSEISVVDNLGGKYPAGEANLDLVVTAKWASGAADTVVDNYTTNYDKTKVTAQEVTVTYSGKTAKINVAPQTTVKTFADLKTAVDNATAGDTIYVEGNIEFTKSTAYPIECGLYLDKAVKFIGKTGTTFKYANSDYFRMFNIDVASDIEGEISFFNIAFEGNMQTGINSFNYADTNSINISTANMFIAITGAETMTLDSLTLKKCSVSYFSQGITYYAFTNVGTLTVEDCEFVKNSYKAIYVENSDVTVIKNNVFDGNAFATVSDSGWYYPSVVDINLKYKTYTSAEITGNVFKNSGLDRDIVNTTGSQLVLAVKARKDGTTYGAKPAALESLVITDNKFENNFVKQVSENAAKGNYELKVGEPGATTNGIAQADITESGNTFTNTATLATGRKVTQKNIVAAE